MPRASHRSEQASAFFAAVYAAVSEVPYGKVTSYAQIARLVGKPYASTARRFHGREWVLGDFGRDKADRKRKRGPSGATRQAAALRAEGVEVQRSAMGEYSVDFGVYGWFPDMLPSEEAELAEESDEET
ncbi:hypothetical protein EG328_001029 [Venturia inaequalis]|uniref:Methylated-DNA-[protein]-cysteine S-methyltransferase DNA binding domain-containing protein n=1 Tax=Venturia inaequalis TaxID=5025 RepID=A0A8H3Z0Y6_VENIN|nr:hypothetical protein EG328_001029 [Venturia inaequalis]